MEEFCSLVCSLLHAQIAFFHNASPPAYGWSHPQWAGPFCISLIKATSHRYGHWSIRSKQFFIWGSLFPNDSRLFQVDNRPVSESQVIEIQAWSSIENWHNTSLYSTFIFDWSKKPKNKKQQHKGLNSFAFFIFVYRSSEPGWEKVDS